MRFGNERCVMELLNRSSGEKKFKKYLAHRNEAGIEDEIKNHSRRVGELTAFFAKKFNAENFGKRCGLSHDIGKYSDDFQEMIRGKKFVLIIQLSVQEN